MKRMPWEISRDMFLSLHEVQALLACVRSPADATAGKAGLGLALDRVIVETLLFSGLRNSELCRLCLGDLSTTATACMLQVRGAGRDERTVYIPAAVGRLLSEFLSHWRPQLLPAKTNPHDPREPLLFNERHKPYERTGLYRRVIRILSEAGLGDRASVQLLRHTYGYLAYRQTGGNLLFVQRQLGHAHPIITSVYARLVDEAYDEMADRVYQETPPASIENSLREGASK